MTDEDISHALDAIKAAVRDLVSLTASDEAEQLLLEADALRVRVESWRDTPRSAVEREQVMARVLRLREAAATCAQTPFTRSPSAPPPSGVHASAGVKVPHAGPVSPAVGPIETTSFVLPEKRVGATTASTAQAAPTPDPASPNAAAELVGERHLPRPGERQTHRNRRSALIGAALVAVLVGGWAARTWAVRHRGARLAVEVRVHAERAPPTATSVPDAASPVPDASTDATADVTAETSANQPFDRAAARAALDAALSNLADCRIPKERSVRAKLTFAPVGDVSSASVLPPYGGTRWGACITAHLAKAQVAPFTGPPVVFVYALTISR